MLKTIKFEPEDMRYEGREVLLIVCKATALDRENHNKKLRKYALDNKKAVKRVAGSGAIKFYESVKEAADDSSISYSSVSKCLNKKQPTAGGYTFYYIKE